MYQITDQMISELINRLNEAVQDSYLIDSPTLRKKDIKDIVEDCIFGKTYNETKEVENDTN